MKVTLTFDLPDERHELMNALYGGTYSYVLSDIDSTIRGSLEYGTPLALEDLREDIREQLAGTPWGDG